MNSWDKDVPQPGVKKVETIALLICVGVIELALFAQWQKNKSAANKLRRIR